LDRQEAEDTATPTAEDEVPILSVILSEEKEEIGTRSSKNLATVSIFFIIILIIIDCLFSP
jgi:hypothetical protein